VSKGTLPRVIRDVAERTGKHNLGIARCPGKKKVPTPLHPGKRAQGPGGAGREGPTFTKEREKGSKEFFLGEKRGGNSERGGQI